MTLSEIEHKFGHDSLSICYGLCNGRILAYQPPQSEQWTTDASHTSGNGRYTLMLYGEKYVEDRIAAFRAWFLPVLLSSVSLIISIVSAIIAWLH